MIHYHGTRITPETVAVVALTAGNACIRHGEDGQLALAVSVCQTIMLDNGAFPAWVHGRAVTDWRPYYAWAAECQRIPSVEFAIIPDVIDGDVKANDDLLAQWPLGKFFGAPVWHLHEPLARLQVLVKEWPRVCLGSSGEFAKLKTPAWWQRMDQAMRAACDEEGRPFCKLHGLRMLDPDVFTRFPFASADSTNIARNVGIDKNWANGNYPPRTKEARAAVMRDRIESYNAPDRYDFSQVAPAQPIQGALCYDE